MPLKDRTDFVRDTSIKQGRTEQPRELHRRTQQSELSSDFGCKSTVGAYDGNRLRAHRRGDGDSRGHHLGDPEHQEDRVAAAAGHRATFGVGC